MKENQLTRYGAIAKSIDASIQAKVFFVGPSSADFLGDLLNTFPNDNDGVARVVTTISAALTNCVANRGDIIYVLPGYTETVTSALTISKAGVSVIGLGNGTLRPTITGNGTIDAVNITAANVTFDNFHFAAPETDEQTACINVAGVAGVTIRNITGVGSKTAKNVVDMITVAASSDNLTIENVSFYNTTVAVNSFLSLEGACTSVKIKNFKAFGAVATAGIIDGALISDLVLEDVVVHVSGSSKSAIVLDSNPTGHALRVYAKGTNTTLASNVNYGNALALFEVRTAEDYSVQGAVIPAADTE